MDTIVIGGTANFKMGSLYAYGAQSDVAGGPTDESRRIQGQKPTVLNLWASWCPPCVREMPMLHQAQLGRPA
ncbi:MAG: TlpA disulfide reductase family protein [Rubrivivax sp.]|nr:TlpA disulfide reductase family protein [Rubrivivax sp.]